MLVVRNRNRFAFGEIPASPPSPSPIVLSQRAQFDWPTPAKVKALLEGFCPEPRQGEWIVANAGDRMLCLRLSDIDWVRALDDSVELRIGPRTHRLRDSLAVWEAKLPPDRFIRLRDSLIVNRKRIQRTEPAMPK
jgi:DNA-binding LytR/AlgR family response regulator